jgi:hypothetical protein
VPICLLMVILAACSKDKYQTKPTIRIKDQSRVVPFDSEAIFYINLEFTDKEGDLSSDKDSAIYYKPIMLNTRSVIGGSEYPEAYAAFPDFPDKTKGEIEIRMEQVFFYRQIQNNQGGNDANDTLIFKIAITDRAGNTSDTLTSEPIILLGQ